MLPINPNTYSIAFALGETIHPTRSFTSKINANAKNIIKMIDKDKLYNIIKFIDLEFEKDNNKCIICGNNEKLHAHHIIPLSNIVNPYINSANENNIEELLNNILNDSVFNNINNGVSLCEECHYKCHNLGFKK